MRFVASLLLGLAFALGATTAVRAADYLVLIDADRDASTGCQVVLPVTGALDGFEHRITASVDAGATPPMVTGVTLERCEGAGFGAATVIGGGYPVGVGVGTGGSDVVEIAVNQALVSGATQGQARIVFAAISNEGDDATASVLFQILAAATAIPSLSAAALMLLAAALAMAARRQLGHPAARHLCLTVVLVGLAGGLAIAANFATDGAVGDWAGTAPLVSDVQGDGNGDTNADLFAGFAAQEGGRLFFRMDVAQVRSNAPRVNPADLAIDEHSAAGTPVGTATLSDPLPGLNYTFAITGGNGTGAFAIDPATGLITVVDPALVDFETIPLFSLQVTATDDFVPPRSGSATVTVQLNDLNEAPVVAAATFTIPEGSPAGTAVGSASFTDPDAGQGHVFAITGGNTGGAFAIHATTGQITVADSTPLVFATNPSFTLTVQVTDDGSPAQSGTGTVTIHLSKVNHAPTAQDATFALDEHSAAGTAVGTVTASDGDVPPDTLSYAITAGNTGDVFAIDAATGAITVADAAPLNYEATPTFALTVTVTDDGSPALSDTAAITVNLNDINDPPAVANATFAMDERSADGTVVGSASATDEDLPAQTLSFAITGGNTGNAFAIDATTGEITVATSSALDHSVNPTFTLTVQATDDGSPARSGTATVVVNLNDINEQPAPTGGPFAVSEHSAAGTVVGTVSAGDPDAGQSHVFAIVGGNTGNTFAIDASTGQITVADSGVLDYETNPTFTLQVQATDDGTPPQAGTGSITVALTDVNESPALTGGSFALPENSANGTVVGSVSVSDPDVGQSHSFLITAGNTGGAFAIGAGGQITVANTAALDYETNPGFALTVQVTDNGTPALSDTAAVTVSLIDVNEPPTAIAKSYDAHTHLTINVPAASGLKVGNSDPEGQAFDLTSVGASTPAGAIIAFAADGSFDFTPPPGVTGDVSFGYTLCDAGAPQQCGNGTVTVTVAGPVVWFIDDDAPTGGNGTLAQPFQTLTEAAGVHAAGDRIFVFEGAYPDGLTLASSERLIGQGASGSFDGILGLGTIPAHTQARPTLGGTRPSLGGTVAFGSAGSTVVRGIDVVTTGAQGLTASGATLMDVAEASVFSTNATAVSLANTTGTVILSSTTSSGGTNNVALTNISGAVSLGGGALSGASGAAVSVSGSSANISYGGSVTNTTQGIALTSNSGATIAFSGTLDLNTGANPAFTATGGGTVTASAAASTLTTTSATALNVSDTSIGAAGLTFRSISSSGGGNPGIVLSATGALGGLTVTGTGAAGSGGTIQSKSGLCMNVSSSRDLHLSSMVLQSCAGGGLRAADLANFSLTGSTVSGNGDAVGEHGLHFTNLTGTASITSSAISGSGEDNLHVANATGILDMLTVGGAGCSFTGLSTSPSNDGIYFAGDGAAAMSVTVNGCSFVNHRGDHFQLNTSAATTASVNATFTNNTLTGAATGPGGAGITISSASAAQVGVNLSNNQITGARSSAITLFQNNTSTAGANFRATIANNTIGDPAVADSGSSQADGITVIQNGSGTLTTLIDNNLVREYNNLFGILLRAGDGNGALNATVVRNTVSDPGTFASNGIQLNAGQVTGDSTAVCLTLGELGQENALVGSGANGATDFRLRQRMSTTVVLPGYGGGAADTAAVVGFVQGNNMGTPTGSATADSNGFSNGAACPLP